MSNRWKDWVQKAYPLIGQEKLDMIAACDAEYVCANGGKVKRAAKSPAQMFDESHKKWVEGGKDE